MNQPITIDYYSDVLCIWAWIAQRRMDELHTQYGEQIAIRHHFVDIFGDSVGKINQAWTTKGGFAGFADHVQHACAPFDQACIHPDLWRTVQPSSSANAHLVLKAVQLSDGEAACARLALSIRQAFFQQARDISHLSVLKELAGELGLEKSALTSSLEDGRAIAALTSDYRAARDLGIRGSPSFVLNQGRQTLYGNVSYRILQANVDELLRHPQTECSWC
jgi:predicted DsbA family dithiol-disulfide isomerase